MQRRTLLAATTAMLAGFVPIVARAADTPPNLPGAKLVAADDVKRLADSGATVVDARVASEFSDAHIKGAISIPYREKSAKSVDFDPHEDSFNLTKLPSDKAAAIVFYCNGPDCWKSFKACTVAMKGGYTNVYWYRAGFPDWKSKGLAVE